MRLILGALLGLAVPMASRADNPDYNRDVRPILSNHCFKCHGPGTAKAGVRLDSQKLAAKKDAVVPGKPDESTILERILAGDDDGRMPPPESGPKLTAAQVETLRKWIAAGAEYAPHWSFVPPTRGKVPAFQNTKLSARNVIDQFVFARLAAEKLTPSPEADKPTLLRRVTLDLTGLLPTPAELDDFLKDESPTAYEKVVDRLLQSEHYGERQARHWLDLARYADSNGYTIDGARSIWPYRDWVIRAFNDDMPFDRFTAEQLAGDLLPNPTKDQLTATGFHRNTAYNEEGGSDPEQFRVERTVDRANTTGAVWLGLTFGCAQCHDHKYDPVSQKDYYRLYAFFDNCDEPTLTIGGDPELDRKVNELTAKADQLNQEGKVDEAKKVRAEINKVKGKIPSTLIVRERTKNPRETFVQIRGDFLRKGDKVSPGFASAISTANPEKPLSRLDLANWLCAPENPLTSRVVVNRAWQQFFGKGLVDTENDFGMQGSLPTHPELLDWLAVEFRERGWSQKKLHRLIVASATYRQASIARPDAAAKDPLNKLLARQNRLRVEAEIIRDAALTASGLLSRKVGGPGVYPPLPAEVFSFTQNKKAWPESKGEDRYRRGMYTYIWRQSQHHLLTTFDGADAQTACTKRNRSNTPLQALHLANDPAFVEFAEAFGERIEKDGPPDDAGKLAFAYRLCFAREPSSEERERLLAFLETQRKTDAKTAWARVGRVLMNLDEFVTRE